MKKIIVLLLTAALLLGACTAKEITTEYAVPGYRAITQIDRCVTEPDESAVMTDADRDGYTALMEGMLAREDVVTPGGDGDSDRIDFYLDLLRRSPYGFFVKTAVRDGQSVRFTYAYAASEQQKMLEEIDSAFLEIANTDAQPDDNELDVILKIYSAAAHRIRYDSEREDNKQLGSPLFDYPGDEVYKALTTGESLCYGFAYVMRFALLQRGIDAFCVYGECRAHNMGHEWVIFRYDGRFFHCDPAWDRSGEGYAKLLHFGKTDAERAADTIVPKEFASYHEPEYGKVVCDDDRFSIFRDIIRFTYVKDHRYYIEDRGGKGAIFDSQTFTIE